VAAVVGVDEFVEGLAAIPGGDGYPQRVTDYLAGHHIDDASMERYVHFRDDYYTRNLVFKNEQVEVLALCWGPGQISAIHNHRDQHCWMVMSRGTLENQNYKVHDRDEERGTCRLEASGRVVITRETPLGVDMDEPVHHVANLAEWAQPAVSLHIYAAPFDTCEVYCPRTNTYKVIELSYWSEFGNPCEEGPPA
jgi:predicted metal-dependent enzyme (double-stranded beta helix superfamily)